MRKGENVKIKFVGKAAATLGFVAILAGGFAGTASAASALATPTSSKAGEDSVGVLACGVTAPDKDSSSWNATAITAANQRSGPSTSCAILGVAQTSDRLDYHCYDEGENGTWTYLRNDRTNVQGWVKDSLLEDYGSRVHC